MSRFAVLPEPELYWEPPLPWNPLIRWLLLSFSGDCTSATAYAHLGFSKTLTWLPSSNSHI